MSVSGWVSWGGAVLILACDGGGGTHIDTSDSAPADSTDTSDPSDGASGDTADTSDPGDGAPADTPDTTDPNDGASADTPDTVQVPLILINEIGAVGDPSDWVELYNADTVAVDLSGWRLRDDDPTHDAALAEGTSLLPGAYLVLDRDGGAWGFGLGSTDAVVLMTAGGLVVDAVAWIDGDSPAGATWARLPDAGATWATSWQPTPGASNLPGTPPEVDCGDGFVDPLTELCDGAEVGGRDCLRWGFAGGSLACDAGCKAFDFSSCTPRVGLVINEVTSSGDDLVELFNGSDVTLSLAGYSLVDDGDNAYTFPARDLAAGAYLVLVKGADPAYGHSFGVGSGDALWLYDPSGALVDHVDWEEGEALVSYCRTPDAIGRFAVCATATFGSMNPP